jgi:DNA adenine methylase
MGNSYPFSRSEYNTAYNIVKGRTSTNCKVTDAWALWYVLNFSYGRKIGGGFIYSGNAKRIKESILGYNNRKAGFTEHYQECLSYALIECADAIEIIRRYDNKDTLFYIDPPYYMANMGHYDGYTAADFVLLLQSLEGIKGKFLLSSYPCEVLAEYSQKNNWINKKQILPNNMKNRCVNKLPKVEVLTRNYQLLPKQYEQLTLLERSPS